MKPSVEPSEEGGAKSSPVTRQDNDPSPAQQAQENSYRWATITTAGTSGDNGTLRLRLDGDTDPLPYAPDALAEDLALGDRVWVQLIGRRIILLGKSLVGPGGGGGATDHAQLTGRSAADGHPTAAITGLDTALAAKFAKTGGTLTGDTYINTAAGAVANFGTMSGGLLRWAFGKSNLAESGANAGSDFNFSRWDDAGNWLGNALTIVRKTGKAIFEGDLQAAYGIFTYGADMGGSKITGLANGTVAGDAVSKAQLDTKWTMWTGTQAAYDAIGTKDQSTLYVVTG